MYYNSTFGTGILGYLSFVLSYRNLLFHLLASDLRARFRRTYLGIIWALIIPLSFAGALTFLFSAVFHQPWQDMVLYVYTGVTLWDYFLGAITRGSDSFSESAMYIKQNRLPIVIFPIRAVLSSFVYFLIASIGFVFLAMIVKPEIISFYWLYIVVFILLSLFLCMPIAIFSAFINTKMRDFQNFLGIILQFLMFLSPVFIVKEVYLNPKISWFSSINPVFALCNLLRDPLLYASAPAVHDVLVILIWGTMFWVMSIVIAKQIDNKIVYYI